MVCWTVAAAIAAAGLVWASFLAEQSPRWAGVFGVQRGSALPFATCLLMLAFAQLSAIVYWYRKRSRRDFAGKYRRWLTAAAVAIAAACCQQTGCHGIAARELSMTLPPASWNTLTVCWVVPAAVVLVFLAPALLRELRAFGVSSTLFTLATLALTAALTLPLVGSVALPADTAMIATRLTLFSAFWCLAISIWWHARHVVRVSNEPPPAGQIGAELRRFIPRPKLAFFRRGKKDEAAGAETDEESEDVKQAESALAPTKRRKRKPQTDPNVGQDEAADAKPGVAARFGAALTSPFRKARAGMQARSAARAEARELKRLEREEQKAAKLKAAEDRKAAKQAAVAERETAKAKAREDQAAARAAKSQANAKGSPGRAVEKTSAGAADEVAPSDTNSQQTAAERRAARKAARAERQRTKNAEAELPDELRDDFGHEPEGRKRRKLKRKKSRR